MVFPTDSLTGLIPVVVTAGVVHKITENVFDGGREDEFDEEEQKIKNKETIRRKRLRRASSDEGQGSIFDDLSNTSFDDFG